MRKHKSKIKYEREVCIHKGFAEGVNFTKEIIVNKLKDDIQNGTIVIVKGSDKIFDIINSVGN